MDLIIGGGDNQYPICFNECFCDLINPERKKFVNKKSPELVVQEMTSVAKKTGLTSAMTNLPKETILEVLELMPKKGYEASAEFGDTLYIKYLGGLN